MARPSGPAFGRSRTYGDWPNREEPRAVPADASLRGGHAVRGNYSPEIRFALDRDFLDKVVMEPRTVECTVPREVAAKAGTPMFSFIAYGEEANFAHPPRPRDPRAPWAPFWTAKVRFKSTASLMLGESAGQGRRRARQETRQQEQQQQQQEQQPQPAPQAKPEPEPDPVKEGIREGVNLLRGIFGR